MSKLVGLILLVASVTAQPLDTSDNAGFEDLIEEVRESTLVPVLFNPLSINKLTCGSLITLYDASTTNLTVAVDVCLVSVLLLKLLVVVPALVSGLQLGQEGGIFNLLDTVTNALERLDLAGSGPEGEPFLAEKEDEEPNFAALAGVNDNNQMDDSFVKKSGSWASAFTSLTSELASLMGVANSVTEEADNESTEAKAQPPEAVNDDSSSSNTYTGFGFSGWSSGVQQMPSLSEQGLYDYLPRGFPAAAASSDLRTVLRRTLKGMERAVHVERH